MHSDYTGRCCAGQQVEIGFPQHEGVSQPRALKAISAFRLPVLAGQAGQGRQAQLEEIF